MRITRHFVDVPAGGGVRRVHYRRCGRGPPLLLVHQSPRSSAEYAPLMEEWGPHFTCIAPDTPGFGQSAPLSGEPEIGEFADALIATMDALGLGRTAAYGFHSGGIILAAALQRHPERFHGLAIGGYAVWSAEERQAFGAAYLPPFRPQPYGEHLAWLWHRVLEQSWFFPWFDPRGATRLSVAHDDPARVHAVVMDMLDAGDAYRAGYGAVLRAERGLPAPDATLPPVLITAYDGDPLQAHIDRLGTLPNGWAARRVATPADHRAASLAFLTALPAGPCPAIRAAGDEGFVAITTERFDGLLHRRGDAISLPGFGLSDDWAGPAPEQWRAWQAVIDASGGPAPSPPPAGDPDRLYPDLTPDRFGAYLHRAWGVARAAVVFAPWYAADAAHARAFDPAELAPERLASAHRDILRARSARAYHMAASEQERRDGDS